MKEYTLVSARSFVKRGPSGYTYIFEAGKTYGAYNLQDEEMLDDLCTPKFGSILKRTDPAGQEKPILNIKKVSDMLPNYEKPEPTPIKYTPTPAEREAELAIEQSKERVAQLRKEPDPLEESIYTYLNPQALETVNSALEAVSDFLEAEDIPLSKEDKIERIMKFIEADQRTSLHTKVKKLLYPSEG